MRAQNQDGSWGDNPGFPGEVGNTCIAALALMATGDTISRGEHSRRIRRAVDWLLQRTRGVGAANLVLDRDTLLQRKLGENIDLYLVALLWSQVLGQHPDAEIAAFAALRRDAEANPLVRSFAEAQELLQGVADLVNGFVGKTLQTGRVPTHDEVFAKQGGCGSGCGCH